MLIQEARDLLDSLASCWREYRPVLWTYAMVTCCRQVASFLFGGLTGILRSDAVRPAIVPRAGCPIRLLRKWTEGKKWEMQVERVMSTS
jgi:hypothetical protein